MDARAGGATEAYLQDDRTARWAGCSRRLLVAGVATAARYFETKLGWRRLSQTARRERCGCPINRWRRAFKQLTPFWPGA